MPASHVTIRAVGIALLMGAVAAVVWSAFQCTAAPAPEQPPDPRVARAAQAPSQPPPPTHDTRSDSEEDADPPVARPAPPPSQPLPPMRYTRLDSEGGAGAPGAYVFLQVAGDPATAIPNVARGAAAAVELRLHPIDADGTAQAAALQTIAVGDIVDYRPNGWRCGFRFRITSTATATAPAVFGLEYLARYGVCGDGRADPGGDHPVDFLWNPSPGSDRHPGLRIMADGEPPGAGTYLIAEHVPYLITIPEGATVRYDRLILSERSEGSDGPTSIAVLVDHVTGAELWLDADDGREWSRRPGMRGSTMPGDDPLPNFHALFDAIMASLRPLNPLPLGPDGRPVMQTDLVLGPGTYRVAQGFPVVLTIPEGLQLMAWSPVLIHPVASLPEDMRPPTQDSWPVELHDRDSGAAIVLSLPSGVETFRRVPPGEGPEGQAQAAAIHALLDALVQSIRLIE